MERSEPFFSPGKVHNLIREMDRLKIEILGISEARSHGNGNMTIDDHYIFYSGQDTSQHWNGVGFVLTKKMNKFVKSVTNVSDRVMLLQLNAKPMNVNNIIQVYAPTSLSTAQECEDFYADMKQVLDNI